LLTLVQPSVVEVTREFAAVARPRRQIAVAKIAVLQIVLTAPYQ
jgi:hypothetical protein